MKRLIKIIAIFSILVLLLLSVSSCAWRYRKEYKGAYTLICNQVPGTIGTSFFMMYCTDPQIILLEKDGMGRGLYLYYEDPEGLLSICIVQRETDEHVYFYPEQSTLSFRLPDYMYGRGDEEIADEELIGILRSACTDEKLNEFKSENDWNEPINESKLERVEITTPKMRSRIGNGDNVRVDSVNLSNEVWTEQIIAAAERGGHEIDERSSNHFHHAVWMATDAYGRRLYYVEGNHYEYPEGTNIVYISYRFEMIAIINPDGTFNSETFMVELEDKANYQEQLRSLKLANGWNTPIN